MEDPLIVKAKRRIKKFIATDEHQPRVYQIHPNIFEYKVRHHQHSLFFKRDKLGRLRVTNK